MIAKSTNIAIFYTDFNKMKVLILCPDNIPKNTQEISSFFSLTNYYIPRYLNNHCDCHSIIVPKSNPENHEEIRVFFKKFNFSNYDAIIALGLRYFSLIPKDIILDLKRKFYGLICQIYDGARAKNDLVDITFTMKNDISAVNRKYWYKFNKGKNFYIGWASDFDLNYPNQDRDNLRILLDHGNYAENNPIDKSLDVYKLVKDLKDSGLWGKYYSEITVRKFLSNKVVDVTFDCTNEEKYTPSKIPYKEICKEHGKTHIFMVTHPESLGLVALETAMAGALVVTPKGFIAKDRLKTIRHIEYKNTINWKTVLENIDIKKSRSLAIQNSWDKLALNILNGLKLYS